MNTNLHVLSAPTAAWVHQRLPHLLFAAGSPSRVLHPMPCPPVPCRTCRPSLSRIPRRLPVSPLTHVLSSYGKQLILHSALLVCYIEELSFCKGGVYKFQPQWIKKES